MDDAAIVLEKERLLEQKHDINIKIAALPLTTEEQEHCNEEAREREETQGRRECVAAVIIGMVVVGFGIAILILGSSWIYSLIAHCQFPLFSKATGGEVCDSTPVIVSFCFACIGGLGCAFAGAS